MKAIECLIIGKHTHLHVLYLTSYAIIIWYVTMDCIRNKVWWIIVWVVWALSLYEKKTKQQLATLYKLVGIWISKGKTNSQIGIAWHKMMRLTRRYVHSIRNFLLRSRIRSTIDIAAFCVTFETALLRKMVNQELCAFFLAIFSRLQWH